MNTPRKVFLTQSEKTRNHLVIYGIAILIGVVLGVLVIFVPPLYLAFGVGGVIFAYLLFFQIDWAVLIALLTLEVLRDYNYLGGGTPFHPNGAMGLSLIAGGLAFFAFNKIDTSRLIAYKFFLGFTLVSFISLVFAGERLMEGLTVTLRLLSGLAIYLILVYKTDSIKKVIRVVAVTIIALVWPTLTGLLMIIQGEGERFLYMETARLGGGTSGPGVFWAMFLILCVVFFLNVKSIPRRLLWGSLCVLFGIALFFSYGRAGWIGFAIGLFFIGVIRHRKLLFLLPLLLILLLISVPAISQRFSDISQDQLDNRDSSTFAVRIELWRAGWEVYKDNNPFFGVGYGVERYRIGKHLGRYELMPHNDYLGMLVATGLVGFILFILWHGQWLKELYKVYRQSKIEFDKTLSLGIMSVFVVSLVVRLSDNIVQNTGRLYPLAALVAVALVLPRIRAAEEARNADVNILRKKTDLAKGRL